MPNRTEKTRLLAQWEALLGNPAARDDLDVWKAQLHVLMTRLQAEGLIDQPEAINLAQLANAMYARHVDATIKREL